MTDKLEPLDTKRCQGESRRAYSFMTLGIPGWVRCDNKPTWIGVDIKEGTYYGAMSLCDECKKVCEIKIPSAKYQKLA